MSDKAAREHELRRNAEKLVPLRRVDAFAFLLTRLERKKERMVESLVQRVLSDGDLTKLQRQMDYDRGFIDGMNYPERILASAAAMLAQPESEPDDEEVEDLWA